MEERDLALAGLGGSQHLRDTVAGKIAASADPVPEM
jgi:hypothetical protein